MSKRRTKKEKLRANHSFIFGTKGIQLIDTENLVKSQLDQDSKKQRIENKIIKNPINTEREKSVYTIKKDILKSLGLTALILGLEVVLYFVWNKP